MMQSVTFINDVAITKTLLQIIIILICSNQCNFLLQWAQNLQLSTLRKLCKQIQLPLIITNKMKFQYLLANY